MKELPKVYDPKTVEKKIYQLWIDGDYFRAEIDPDKKPFSIVMPPPNVTGQLHLGHACDSTLQDILTRYIQFDVGFGMGLELSHAKTNTNLMFCVYHHHPPKIQI